MNRPVDKLGLFTDLAAERLGGRAVLANDEFFAAKENLLKAEPPTFVPDRYTDRGKWMDGWETRRRRDAGHDWCIVKLGLPGRLLGVDIDTTHFKGNHPEAASLDACDLRGDPAADEIVGSEISWVEVLPRSRLQPHASNAFAVDAQGRFTHVRLNIFPDGGVARLRVYGKACPDWATLLADDEPVDLAAALHGGLVRACSDMFFSAPRNLIMPGRGANMADGWETKRRRGPGFDWCIIELGHRGTVEGIEVDTAHFKGNYPDRCSVEIADVALEGSRWTEAAAAGDAAAFADVTWNEILPPTKLEADRSHRFAVAPEDLQPCTLVRFNIYPDGGVSRVRLYGRPAGEAADP